MKESNLTADLYYFTKMVTACIYLPDSDSFIDKISINKEKSYGSDDFTPLSTSMDFFIKCKYFVKLYDEAAYKAEFYAGTQNVTKKSNRIVGVNKMRANARFINKFTVHGKKERSLKYFSRAASHILSKLTIDELNVVRLLTYTGFYINVDELLLYANTIKPYFAEIQTDYAQIESDTATAASILENNHELLTTEYIFYIMQQHAPVYSMILSKLSKTRYKNTRGKRGRYEMTLHYIPQESSIRYMFKLLKHSWYFSKKNTFFGKYVDVLIKAAIRPKTSLGYALGKKSLKKMLK